MYADLGKKTLYTAVLAAALVLSGCSSSGGSGSGGGDVAETSTSSGLAVDGYIAGGHLYADLDGSATENVGDINTTTDALGNFSFGATEIPHGTYLYLTGGTDIATNSPFTGRLSASFEGNETVVSPVSSMVVAMMLDGGKSYDAAVSAVSAMLGLTEAQVEADPYTDPAVFIAAQRIVSAASLLGTPTEESFSEVVAALAASDMNITQTAADLGVPAEDALAVDEYITGLLPLISETATVDELEAYQVIVTEAVDDPTNLPDVDLSASVANALGCVTFDAIKGSNTAEGNITTDLVLGNCENGDDNVTFAWSSDNTAVLGSDGVVVRPDYTGGDVNLSLTVTSDVNSSVTSQKSFALSVPRLDNRLPTAVADANTTTEETAVSFNVLANDSDADGDALTLVAVSDGVAYTADGTVTYTPAVDFNGDFVFSYTVRDSWNGESNATVTVTVAAVNDAPVLDAIGDVDLAEDFGTASIEINATDVDSGSLTYSVLTAEPAIVNAAFGTGNQLDLTSIADLFGDTNITVMVSDGDKNDTATFAVHIAAVDDAPVIAAIADPSAVDEDADALTIAVTASDVDSLLTLDANSSNPSIATAVISGSDVVVTPVANASGTVTITVSADDGVNPVVTASFTVTINAVDDAPVLAPLSPITVDEDNGTTAVTATATDVDNDDAAIVYGMTSSDTNIVTVSGMDLTTVADANGVVEINVTATSNGKTDWQTFTFTVTAVDDAPVLDPIAPVTVNEDNGTIIVTPNATDIDSNDSLITYELVSLDPSVVTVSGSDLVTVANANGVATIEVTARSGALSDTTDFNVTVTPVNDAPTASDFTVPVVTGSSGNTIDLSTHIDDVDGDALAILTFDATTGLSQSGPTTFNYDNDGTEGLITFNYTVEDPDGLTAGGVVTLNVSAEPIIPVANDDTATTDEEVAVNIDVLANDINATTVTDARLANSANGTVTVEANNTITFDPAVDKNGDFIIFYTAASDTANEANASVTVHVVNINDAPVIDPIAGVEVDEDTPTVTIPLSVNDVDNPTSNMSAVTNVDTQYVQVVSVDETELVLGIQAQYYGVVTVTVTADDGELNASQSFDLTINSVLDTPQISAFGDLSVPLGTQDSYFVNVGNTFGETIILEANSTDTSVATVTVGGISGHEIFYDGLSLGSTVINLYAYNDLNASLNDSYSFTLTVYDPSNVAPVAGASEITVVTDSVIQTALNVSDNNGDPMTFTIVTLPAHGNVISIDEWGNLVYAAADAYIGEDSFTYKASDGVLESDVATVTVHVTASPDADSDNSDLTEKPITLAEYNALVAQTAYGIPMYSVWEEGWGTESNLTTERLIVNESPQQIEIFYIEQNTTELIPYTLEGPGETISIDFDSNGSIDFEVKYIGTVTKTELENDLNLTLPADASGYKLATLQLTEEYTTWDTPEYRDWNASGGFNPYTSLSDYMVDKSYDPNTPSWSAMWIDGYNFKFAEGSGLGDMNGTLIRTAIYWDGSSNVEIVTNSSAGTWEVVYVDAQEYIKVTPTVYGLDRVAVYTLSSSDSLVHGGEYLPPNSASLEYKFDETTVYYIGNSIMNRMADLPSKNLVDASGEFISFNTLPTLPLVKDTGMYSIYAYEDFGSYTINIHGLYFDSNGSLYMTDTQDGDVNMTYTMNGDIASIDGIGIDGKVAEVIASAADISAMTGVPEVDLPASPVAYRFAHISANEELNIWDNTVLALDGTTTYSSYSAFETAFMSAQVALDYTPSGGIGYGSGEAGVGGTLSEYSATLEVITPNAGTWEVLTVDGQQVLVFDVTVPRNGDHNAIALSGNTGLVSDGEYLPPNSGSVELRFNTETRDAIVAYLQAEYGSGNPINFEQETRIMLDVEAVPFTNSKMYEARVDFNTTNCDRNVSTAYVWLDGTGTSGNFVISDDPESYTYASSDGKVATVTMTSTASEVFMVKVKEELNATQLMSATNLYLPATAYGYRISYMDIASGEGGTMLRLDGATIGFLESYLNNNTLVDSMCLP